MLCRVSRVGSWHLGEMATDIWGEALSGENLAAAKLRLERFWRGMQLGEGV
jgi:hypothetical protein